jgi:hypothetical protein
MERLQMRRRRVQLKGEKGRSEEGSVRRCEGGESYPRRSSMRKIEKEEGCVPESDEVRSVEEERGRSCEGSTTTKGRRSDDWPSPCSQKKKAGAGRRSRAIDEQRRVAGGGRTVERRQRMGEGEEDRKAEGEERRCAPRRTSSRRRRRRCLRGSELVDGTPLQQ